MTLLDKDGKDVMTLGQSNACIRYIGSIGGIYPENPLERALCDEVIASSEDLIGVAAGVVFSGLGAEEKAAKAKKVCSEALPYWLGKFEARLEENEKRGNKKGGFVEDAYTIADCKLFSAFVYVNMLPGGADVVKNYKKLGAFLDAFAKDEKIKAFKDAFHANVEKYKADKSNDFKYDGKCVECAL